VVHHFVATLKRDLDLGNVLSDALELVCLRRKFGNARIGRFDILINLRDAAKFVLEVHEGSYDGALA
jgi:hypothetical protein